MTTTYVVLIDASKSAENLNTIKKLMPNEPFRSKEYMHGFLDGYLFEHYQLLTLSEFESRCGSMTNPIEGCYLTFVQHLTEGQTL